MKMYYNLDINISDYRQIVAIIGAQYLTRSHKENDGNEIWDLQQGIPLKLDWSTITG